jgi:hypothetical protein
MHAETEMKRVKKKTYLVGDPRRFLRKHVRLQKEATRHKVRHHKGRKDEL